MRQDQQSHALNLSSDSDLSHSPDSGVGGISTANPLQAAESIDIALLLNAENAFLPAAMLLCNELKARFSATQVSLGWLNRNHIKIRAISNTPQFDKRDAQLTSLVYAMEECSDQNEEIIAPLPEGESFINREHEKYLHLTKNDCVVSLPLRLPGEQMGVVTLERSGRLFDVIEVQTLRLILDLASKRLYELEQRSQWFGKRWARKTRNGLAWVFGFEHTWTKLGFLVLLAVLGILIFYPWHYRVEAPFQLKVENVMHMPAPYNGFIESVHADIGDTLDEGALLLSLDKRELLLEHSESMTKIKRYESEASSNKTLGNYQESNLARIAIQEEKARLDLIEHRIDLADLKAPFEGIVVEGDLDERIGAPVQTGDPLFKMAKLTDVYVRLEISEADIHEVAINNTGEFAFTSRPELKYPFVIESIEPIAEPQSEGSIFYAKCRVEVTADDWWRPGMNGVSKIDVGDRSILWVLTHRLVDFIRMKLWI